MLMLTHVCTHRVYVNTFMRTHTHVVDGCVPWRASATSWDQKPKNKMRRVQRETMRGGNSSSIYICIDCLQDTQKHLSHCAV